MKRQLSDLVVKSSTFKKLAQTRQVSPGTQGLKLADGGGLYLWISAGNAKSWRYKYRLLGREGTFVIGSYPQVSLAEARKAHELARKQVAQGIDPGKHKKAELQKAVVAGGNTFEAVARAWIAHKANPDNPRHCSAGYATKVLRILERDVFPKVGALNVGDVGAAELSSIMEAVASRKKLKMPHQKKVRVRAHGATTTAIHIGQIAHAVFAYASSKGIINTAYDPTWALRALVARPEVQHSKYLKPDALPVLWHELTNAGASEQVKLAIKLLAVTFVRTNELRNAEWSEFDLTGTADLGPHWLIPANKTKKSREHAVPLAGTALQLIAELRKLTGHSRYLFPSRSDPDRPMNPNTINQTLYRIGYHGKLSAHGFRATASTALNERGFPSHVVEMQLSHWRRSRTEASYNHATYWPERIKMMEFWANFVMSAKTNVVPFKKSM
ncbi:MAG TPA: integrase arm-type DNA-binding domain-containing protein [Frateuria sp.]|uniref:tyrosine-type recombinase/integrase n=1 Tax=Frateuria sp. TaxID=2211372 RepID=UPI002DEEE656|nr:integrase arm-type DNA-binding domain-containing protein [Frateuria sp.]